MIARMSKYDFVLFAAQSADFIDRLRELGLVDITVTGWEPTEQDRQLLLDIEAGNKAVDFLKAWADEPEHKESKAQPYASGAEAFAGYLRTQREAAAAKAEIARLEKAADELRPWGDFDAARAQQLAKQGIVLRYFFTQRNTYDKASAEWSEQYTLSEIARTDSTVCNRSLSAATWAAIRSADAAARAKPASSASSFARSAAASRSASRMSICGAFISCASRLTSWPGAATTMNHTVESVRAISERVYCSDHSADALS